MERAARPSLNLPVWMHMHVHQPVRKGEPSLAIITVLQMYIASTYFNFSASAARFFPGSRYSSPSHFIKSHPYSYFGS